MSTRASVVGVQVAGGTSYFALVESLVAKLRPSKKPKQKKIGFSIDRSGSTSSYLKDMLDATWKIISRLTGDYTVTLSAFSANNPRETCFIFEDLPVDSPGLEQKVKSIRTTSITEFAGMFQLHVKGKTTSDFFLVTDGMPCGYNEAKDIADSLLLAKQLGQQGTTLHIIGVGPDVSVPFNYMLLANNGRQGMYKHLSNPYDLEQGITALLEKNAKRSESDYEVRVGGVSNDSILFVDADTYQVKSNDYPVGPSGAKNYTISGLTTEALRLVIPVASPNSSITVQVGGETIFTGVPSKGNAEDVLVVSCAIGAFIAYGADRQSYYRRFDGPTNDVLSLFPHLTGDLLETAAQVLEPFAEGNPQVGNVYNQLQNSFLREEITEVQAVVSSLPGVCKVPGTRAEDGGVKCFANLALLISKHDAKVRFPEGFKYARLTPRQVDPYIEVDYKSPAKINGLQSSSEMPTITIDRMLKGTVKQDTPDGLFKAGDTVSVPRSQTIIGSGPDGPFRNVPVIEVELDSKEFISELREGGYLPSNRGKVGQWHAFDITKMPFVVRQWGNPKQGLKDRLEKAHAYSLISTALQNRRATLRGLIAGLGGVSSRKDFWPGYGTVELEGDKRRQLKYSFTYCTFTITKTGDNKGLPNFTNVETSVSNAWGGVLSAKDEKDGKVAPEYFIEIEVDGKPQKFSLKSISEMKNEREVSDLYRKVKRLYKAANFAAGVQRIASLTMTTQGAWKQKGNGPDHNGWLIYYILDGQTHGFVKKVKVVDVEV